MAWPRRDASTTAPPLRCRRTTPKRETSERRYGRRPPDRLELGTAHPGQVPTLRPVVYLARAVAGLHEVRVSRDRLVSAEYTISIAKRLEFLVSAETEGEAKALAAAASGAAGKAVRSRCRYVGRRLAVERCEPAAPLAAPSA
jgi:hypothetical protein